MTDNKILKVLDELLPKKTCQCWDWNEYNVAPNIDPITKENANKFNRIYLMMKNSNWHTTKRTKSGSIAKGIKNRTNCRSWYMDYNSRQFKLVIIAGPYIYVYKLGYSFKKKSGVYPTQAFEMFKAKCLEEGIVLDDYKIDNGAEVKKTISKPLIKMHIRHTINDKGLENCHHVDFHNSYPAGLVNTHPEFKSVVEYFYKNRKYKPEYKDVLNYTIGYMQSLKGNKTAAWAQLSKDAIHDNLKRMMRLCDQLIKAKREVIGFNTDGIWYRGEIYHGIGEGKELGEWENDHTNCLLRVKSDGAYEFIEDGQYYPVIRGATRLDAVKPREEWQWGDIYQENANVLKYKWHDSVGLIIDDEDGDDYEI